MTALERLLAKIVLVGDYQGTPCWHWTAAMDWDGYGMFWINGGMTRAHRASWLLDGRVIPDGKVLDHLCRNRACVNPLHLEAVTQAVNLKRSPAALATINASVTHCRQGHPYDEANTYYHPKGGNRDCRVCRRAAVARSAARKAVAVN